VSVSTRFFVSASQTKKTKNLNCAILHIQD
jgi:hypothetical protein